MTLGNRTAIANSGIVKAVLTSTGALTVMAGSIVSPALPGISMAFSGRWNATLLAQMVITAHALAVILFSPFIGLLVDRIGYRQALIGGILLFALSGSSGAWLPDLPAILAGRLALGVGMGLITTSSWALIGALYPPDERQKMLSLQSAVTAFSGMLFLLLSGFVAELHWRNVFLIYLLGLPLAIPALIWLPDAGRNAGRGRQAQDGGARAISAGWLTAPLSAAFTGQLIFYLMMTHLPFLIVQKLHADVHVIGYVMAGLAGSMVFAALAAGRFGLHMSRHRRAGGTFLFTAAGYALMSQANSLPVLALGVCIAAAGQGILSPTLSGWVVSQSPEHKRGRYSGLLTTCIFGGQFMSPILVHPLEARVGLEQSFAAAGLLALVIAAALMLPSRRNAAI